MNALSLGGIGRRLVAEGLLEEEVAINANKEAAEKNIPLTTLIAEQGLCDSDRAAAIAAEEFGMPLFDIQAMDKTKIPSSLVDNKLIGKHTAIPLFKRGNRLFIAISDPMNLHAVDEIKFNTGLNTEAVLVEHGKLKKAIETFLEAAEKSSFDTDMGDLDDDLDSLDISAVDEDGEKGGDDGDGIDETPVVRFVNKMLLDAIRGGASDLHFEPYEKAYRVRFRTDGILHETARPPIQLGTRIAARLKVMSQMDLSERRKPQDGRIKMKISKDRAIDFRVNTLPCLFGEKVVLRILDGSAAQMGIESLGYEDAQRKMYEEALFYPQGMILVTGPTGSGKTVSLYTGLNILNEEERNISTAEDPVEINLEGINQCHVNPKVGLTFAEALRSFLRQDPDVIMVGEIRDLETAEISIKAAQTGHMVLSTLHTNSAAETVTRLLNMGVPAFNVATTVSLIIAQRLARRLCSACAKPSDLPKEALIEAGFTEAEINEPDFELKEPVGCDKCKSGYKGRVGVYEVVKISPECARIIMEGGNSIDINDQMRADGFADLRRSALNKAKWGFTSLAEVNRVTKD